MGTGVAVGLAVGELVAVRVAVGVGLAVADGLAVEVKDGGTAVYVGEATGAGVGAANRRQADTSMRPRNQKMSLARRARPGNRFRFFNLLAGIATL